MKCSLCASQTQLFYTQKNKNYYQCKTCNSISLDTENYPSLKEEKYRYLEHNNNVEDKGYQKFVQPIVDIVFTNFNEKHLGLDFGCGPGPVISKLLRDQDYQITTYDPIFDDNKDTLNTKYDYIVCCEVIEHFHNPLKEFKLLRSLLKSNGKLVCKTDLYSEEIDFKKWYYKNDQTHVIFYHKNTFKWIQQHVGFSKISVSDRIITFEA